MIGKYTNISTFVSTAALLAVGGMLLADEDMHWSYSGETGPENWAKLSPEFAACGIGFNQSPIDIGKTVSAELASLQFNYKGRGTSIVNNGHTVQVNVEPDSWLRAGGDNFQLQ